MSADIDRLRDAVRDHDDWPDARTRQSVIDAARSLVSEYDAWAAYVQHMAQQTITPEVAAELQLCYTAADRERWRAEIAEAKRMMGRAEFSDWLNRRVNSAAR